MHKTCHEEDMIAVQYSALLYNNAAQYRKVHCHELQYSKEFLKDQSSFFQSDWLSGHIFLLSCKFADLLARARARASTARARARARASRPHCWETGENAQYTHRKTGLYCTYSCTLWSEKCSVSSCKCSLCSVQFAVQCAVCSMNYLVCSVQYELFSVQCTVCSVQCAMQ